MTKYIVRGQRVLLTPPEIKKSAIEVNAALEKELWEEQMKKWGQLEVFAIGDEVEGIEIGDRVSVNLMFLKNAERIEIEGEDKIIVRAADISVVWK
jgi:hypothetical protein